MGQAQAGGTKPAPMMPTMPGVYVDVYGGAALADTQTWGYPDPYTTDDINLGSALGGAVGMSTGVDGLAIEADLFHTQRTTDSGSDYIVSTTSLMINGKFNFHLSDTFDVYAGAGLGGIYLHYQYGSPSDIYAGWGAGYQFMIGAKAKVTDNIFLTGELRHQDSFGQINTQNGYTNRAPVNAVLIGLQIPIGAPPPP